MFLKNFLDKETISLKICGVKTKEDLIDLLDMGIEAVGFNFYKKSPRYLSYEEAFPLLKFAKNRTLRVGVFVNSAIQEIQGFFEENLIDVAQIYGDNLKKYESISSLGLIQSIPANQINYKFDKHLGKAILLDAPSSKYGGTGISFDWNIAKKFKEENPSISLILAGGINLENIREAIKIHPCAIDIASGGEVSPGKKGKEKIANLLKILKEDSG